MADNQHPNGGDGRRRLRWYREVATVVAFYAVYSVVRNQFGSNSTGARQAYDNAQHLISVQRTLGLFVELRIQDYFLAWGRWFFWFWNVYYGTLHFVVTAGVMLVLYRSHSDRYPRWRNALGVTTGLALVGFSAFPLMPPRLLDAGGTFGWTSAYHFVDSLARYGGLWSFNSETMQSVSNQYAAMPSLHVGWAMWCCCAMYPLLRHRWSKAIAAAYPMTTAFAIIVTGNHYWLDAVGGLVVFGAGYVVSGRVEAAKVRLRPPRRERDEVLVG